MAYNKPKGDVEWFEPRTIKPKTKRPIAYSTVATKDLIVLLQETNETIQDVYNAINYDEEAKAVLQVYIDKGYGNLIAKDLFK